MKRIVLSWTQLDVFSSYRRHLDNHHFVSSISISFAGHVCTAYSLQTYTLFFLLALVLEGLETRRTILNWS